MFISEVVCRDERMKTPGDGKTDGEAGARKVAGDIRRRSLRSDDIGQFQDNLSCGEHVLCESRAVRGVGKYIDGPRQGGKRPIHG